MNEQWPIPFAGINCVVRFNSIAELKAAIAWLVGEGITCSTHAHNFAVDTLAYSIYVSELGASCLEAFKAEYNKTKDKD